MRWPRLSGMRLDGGIMLEFTWPQIHWRALAHVRRDALLYAAEEPISMELITGFVEDALGSAPTVPVGEAADRIVSELVGSDFLVPEHSTIPQRKEFAITERGMAWVLSYYQHLEIVAGHRPAV